MLRNEPPPGTRVRFTKEARKVAAFQVGKLIRPIGYHNERSSDEFLVEHDGEQITVTREEIEEA
jgi:hypothetical protein